MCWLVGHPTLPIVTDDIIDFTIYSDVTHINIANHMEVGDMSIAALSLLPKLEAVLASGSPITNLGLIMLAAAKTITTLNLSRYACSVACMWGPVHVGACACGGLRGGLCM